jgi:carbamoyltransferase
VIILGLNAFHGDSSAAILKDGVLVAAAEEERFRRIKHWAGFPEYAVRYCLAEAGVQLSEVDRVAINTQSRASLLAKIGYMVTSRPDLDLIVSKVRTRAKRASLPELFSKAFPDQTLKSGVDGVEHHAAHLASAFFVSPFREASVVSVDGFGDFSSAAWGVGQGTQIAEEGRVFFPHSLGIFYQALTQYLGFPNYGDEYKVMGLAPYGKPALMDKMREIVRLQPGGSFKLNLNYFVHHRQKIDYDWTGGSPTFSELFSPALEDLLGPRRKASDPLLPRHHDIARSVQAMYEEAFFHLLRTLHAKHRTDNVAIAGGCGMNSVANGKIMRETPYKKVYVQAAAGDAGGAIGAAFAVWHKTGGARTFEMTHAYWGPGYDDDTIGSLLSESATAISDASCKIERLTDEALLCRKTAESIAAGKVVGWFQGRMEWGPRALGNRSIVCDPRRADMKEILNLKIKRRESFRPFAPSIQREHTPDWFEESGDVPFMMQVYQIRPEKRAHIPAVTHVDGSGRLQTVDRSANPRYWTLIEAFRELTGIPMVLNTSFNENEPVVCRPQEALDCFLRTKMDVLAIGNFMLTRQSETTQQAQFENQLVEKN